jgi:hypothetical protein
MIKYALCCAEGHEFESWFSDNAAFEKLRKRRLVACPECGSTAVDKAIMAPAIVGAERAGVERPEGEKPAEVLVDDKRRQVREMVKHLRREIEANTVDVGAQFPALARAIHNGDEPERAIRGQASPDEARALIEEGVGVMPVPVLADEFN